MSNTLIDKYVIRYSSNAFPRYIEVFHDEKHIGLLVFYPDNSRLPPDRAVGDLPMLNYHLEDFQNVLNILKTEKPLYLFYSGSELRDENGLISKQPYERRKPEKHSKTKKK